MHWLNTLLVIIQILSAIAVVVLVLLQHGKGAEMGAAFGGGASGSLFGATGSANFLSRSTAVAATLFFAATLGLVMVTSRTAHPSVAPKGGVLGTVEQGAPAAPTDPSKSAPAAPGAVPASTPGAGAAPSPEAPKSNEIPK